MPSKRIPKGISTRIQKRIAIGAIWSIASIALSPAAAQATRTHAVPRPQRARSRASAIIPLNRPGITSHYAFVERQVVAYAAPSRSSRRIGELKPVSFWGTSQVVLVLARTEGAGAWTRVLLPVGSHDPAAWVSSDALSALHAVHTWLKIDREHFTATLIRNGRRVFRARVGVGQRRWPTPAGRFFIEVSLTPPEADGVYGPLAFGTSAHSKVLTEWPNRGQIGVHGTNQPQLIPGRISHGCVRLRNADILRLGRLMPVGTPVSIF